MSIQDFHKIPIFSQSFPSASEDKIVIREFANLFMVFLWVISTRIMMPTSILLFLLVFIFTSVFMTVLVLFMLFILILILISVFVLFMLPLLVLRLTFWSPCNCRGTLLRLKRVKQIRWALERKREATHCRTILPLGTNQSIQHEFSSKYKKLS